MPSVTYGTGSEDDPWILKTPSLSSDYQAWRDDKAKLPALVVQVGTTRLSYQLRCLDDAVAMLKAARRLDGARQCRRGQAGAAGHAGSLGARRW